MSRPHRQGDAHALSNSKPWAAYALGDISYSLRLWQKVFWRTPHPEAGTWDGVPLAIKQMDDALVILTSDIPAGVLSELRRIMQAVSSEFAESIEGLYTPNADQRLDFASSHYPGAQSWGQLRVLADQALPVAHELRAW
jgi:hypothetical protein